MARIRNKVVSETPALTIETDGLKKSDKNVKIISDYALDEIKRISTTAK